MWDLLFLATIVAFMTLKHQNIEFLKMLIPNGPNYWEKSLTFHIFDPMAFKLAFTTFVGLFQFLWHLWYVKMSNPCQKHTSGIFGQILPKPAIVLRFTS